MQEKDLRKWHRNLGIILAFFILLQALTGLVITLQDIRVPSTHAHESTQRATAKHDTGQLPNVWAIIQAVHHGAGVAGVVNRILLGLGMIGMAVSGSMIC